jgi:hypothetical protein
MPLVVEDGTGLANSESYISVADATTYHANRGNAAWAALASDTVREQKLRLATEYLSDKYRLRWKGTRVTATQALDFPRYGVPREDYYVVGSAPPNSIDGSFYYPSDEVPAEVVRACAELALRAIDGPLYADVEQKVKREKVGPIETEYADGASATTTYTAVDGMLAPFLNSRSSLRMERA